MGTDAFRLSVSELCSFVNQDSSEAVRIVQLEEQLAEMQKRVELAESRKVNHLKEDCVITDDNATMKERKQAPFVRARSVSENGQQSMQRQRLPIADYVENYLTQKQINIGQTKLEQLSATLQAAEAQKTSLEGTVSDLQTKLEDSKAALQEKDELHQKLEAADQEILHLKLQLEQSKPVEANIYSIGEIVEVRDSNAVDWKQRAVTCIDPLMVGGVEWKYVRQIEKEHGTTEQAKLEELLAALQAAEAQKQVAEVQNTILEGTVSDLQ